MRIANAFLSLGILNVSAAGQDYQKSRNQLLAMSAQRGKGSGNSQGRDCGGRLRRHPLRQLETGELPGLYRRRPGRRPDGRADQVTEFVKDLNSPRGMVWDHDRLYVIHPPDISCFIDRDGDGKSDAQAPGSHPGRLENQRGCGTRQEFTWKTAEIAKRETLPNSLMPSGLVSGLTVREFASLLDYLESLAKK